MGKRRTYVYKRDLHHVETKRRRVLNRISHPTEMYIQRVDLFWHMMYVYSHGKETYICVHYVKKRRMSCSESHIPPYRDVYSTSWLILPYAKIRHVTHIWQYVMAHISQYMMGRVWLSRVNFFLYCLTDFERNATTVSIQMGEKYLRRYI